MLLSKAGLSRVALLPYLMCFCIIRIILPNFWITSVIKVLENNIEEIRRLAAAGALIMETSMKNYVNDLEEVAEKSVGYQYSTPF